jgi:hypothetical protein
MAAGSPSETLRMLAYPCVAVCKRRERIHGEPRQFGRYGVCHKGQVMLVQAGAFREWIIGDDVLLDEATDD